ncbi:MAG: GAF domain-containing sensor histidine kinase [Anaerolineales bacterium]
MTKHTYPFPFRDYLFLQSHWLTLLILSIVYHQDLGAMLLLLLNGIGNTLFISWYIFNNPPKSILWFSVGVDILTSGFIILSVQNHTFLSLSVSILPLLAAGFYFSTLGLLITQATNATWLLVYAIFQSDGFTSLFYSGIWFSIDLLICVGIYFLSQRYPHPKIETKLNSAKTKPAEQGIEAERRKALYQIISTLSSTLNYQMVVEKALDMSSQALFDPDQSNAKLVSAFYLYKKNGKDNPQLHLLSARHFTPADMRIKLEGMKGILNEAIESGKAVTATQLTHDAELQRIVALHACHSLYCIPLIRGVEVYGVVLFAHPDPDYFTSDRCEILQIITNQTMVAMENARLYHQLELEKEHIQQIEEDARKKLARDLHDGPTQSISALAMRANFARRLLERDPKAAETELLKMEELARRTTKEIRHMLFTLRPLILESDGLIAALDAMAQKMLETYNQKVIIQADERVLSELELGKQSVIFSIAEEAVNNARKHAQAENIWVRLGFVNKELLLLEIADDGVGFDPNEIRNGYEQRSSMGMVNMQERAELLNGLLQIKSEPSSGTQIRLFIPLSEAASEQLKQGNRSD